MYEVLGSKEKRAIRYELQNVPDGWRLSVVLPKRVPSSDHSVVIRWLQDYQKTVRSQHPNWLTAIRPQERGYVLHIQRANNAREMLNAVNLIDSGDTLKDCWSGALEYAG